MTSDRDRETTDFVEQIRASAAIGDLGAAVRYCRQALQSSPEDLSLRTWLGWLYFNDKRYVKAIECAETLINEGSTSKLDGYRLLLFALSTTGKSEQAAQVFDRVAEISRDECEKIATEIIGSFHNLINDIYTAGDHQAVVTLYATLPRIIKQLETPSRYDIDLIASNSYIRTNRHFSSFKIIDNYTSKSISFQSQITDDQPFAGVTLVTSLMPGRNDLQRTAVDSWHDLGAKVLSVNSPDEIALLGELYPHVTFVAATRDARVDYGKPYVYLRDMIEVAGREPCDVVGIINSDIVLRSTNAEFLESIKAEALHSLVFGHRFDVDDIKSASDPAVSGELYDGGIDWFLFPRKHNGIFSDQPFIFGCPWWDLWLPILASRHKIDTFLAAGRLGFHQRHAQQWNPDTFNSLGHELVRQIDAMATAAGSGFGARFIAELNAACPDDMRQSLGTDRFMLRFAELVRSLIAVEAKTIDG